MALLLGAGIFAAGAGASVAHYRYDHRYALNNLRVSPGATFGVGAAAICRSGYAESVRHVTEAEERRVYAEYGITHRASGQYEVDHVIPLELGGNNALKNLWPEPNDHPHGYLNSKDKLENRLHALVCTHQVSLALARATISRNWVAAYHRFLGGWPHGTVVVPPTTTRPATTLPATARVRIVSIPTRIAPGSMASLTARSPRAHDVCRLSVELPSGRTSTAAGLGEATADTQGVVSWTWRIGGNTGGGSAKVTVACGAGTARGAFTIS